MFGLKAKKEKLEKQIAMQNDVLRDLQRQISLAEETMRIKAQEISRADGIIDMIDMGLEWTPTDGTSSEIEEKINELQGDIAYNLKHDVYFNITRQYRIDGSEAKGRKFQKEFFGNLIIGLDNYIRQKEKTVTAENFEEHKRLCYSALEKFNKRGNLVGFGIATEYINIRMEIMQLKLSMKIAKQNEKEELKEQKRRLAEEEKMRTEAEREKKKLIAEKARWEKIFGEAMTDEKREEAKAKLLDISNRDAKIDYRLANLKSGWVYVISNPALPDMVKIGVTRRLDFTKRIDELNAAGVPYNFIINGVTFSDDCFALETALHQYYDAVRVNKENKHKEFFKVEANDVLNIMKNKFNCELHFIKEEE